MLLADLAKNLGEPYFKSDNCLIYNCDCIEGLDQLPPESIHLTVTSPPYNIGKEYEQVLPIADYLTWLTNCINKLHRVTRPDGAFWLNLGYLAIENRAKAIPIPYLIWDRIPFFLIQEIIWNYSAGVAGRLFFSPRNEKFLWYVKDPACYTFNLDAVRDPNVKYPHQKKNGKIKVNPNGKNPGDVWQFAKVTSGQNRASTERTPHPAQFPLAVIERIISASANPGDFILDPFMGSGTTAVAALSLGRKVIGFEINAQYCAVAAARIEQYMMKQTLPAQVDLFGEGELE